VVVPRLRTFEMAVAPRPSADTLSLDASKSIDPRKAFFKIAAYAGGRLWNTCAPFCTSRRDVVDDARADEAMAAAEAHLRDAPGIMDLEANGWRPIALFRWLPRCVLRLVEDDKHIGNFQRMFLGDFFRKFAGMTREKFMRTMHAILRQKETPDKSEAAGLSTFELFSGARVGTYGHDMRDLYRRNLSKACGCNAAVKNGICPYAASVAVEELVRDEAMLVRKIVSKKDGSVVATKNLDGKLKPCQVRCSRDYAERFGGRQIEVDRPTWFYKRARAIDHPEEAFRRKQQPQPQQTAPVQWIVPKAEAPERADEQGAIGSGGADAVPCPLPQRSRGPPASFAAAVPMEPAATSTPAAAASAAAAMAMVPSDLQPSSPRNRGQSRAADYQGVLAAALPQPMVVDPPARTGQAANRRGSIRNSSFSSRTPAEVAAAASEAERIQRDAIYRAVKYAKQRQQQRK
jgi:hypothetical protein